jgi:hypothetical protein
MDYGFFDGNRAEDALNIIHSKFVMNNVSMQDTMSDALDSDFSEGKVTGGVFQYIGEVGGGDAIDVSGSTIEVDGVTLREISDKALSVGERSTMDVRNVLIEGVGTAVVSKDASQINIFDSVIRNSENVGMMAYIKKPEYGPASIIAKNVSFEKTSVEARSQKGSHLVVNGDVVEGIDMDVEELYRTIMRPGLIK